MRLSNGEVLLSWPLERHEITAGMYYKTLTGYDSWHGAIDMRCTWNGTSENPVFAAEDGIVNWVQKWNGTTKTGVQSYGNAVKILHSPTGGKKLETRYAHLSRALVKAGDNVKAGQIIGYTGNTGNSAGAHLHFEVIYGGKRYNPLCWLDDDFTSASGFKPYFFGPNEHSVFNVDASPLLMKGVDVSKYQGEIDWAEVKKSGCADFAFIRSVSTNGGGIYIDPTFEQNYAGCKKNGIPLGMYYYTYAADKKTANAELSMLKKAITGKSFEWPIVIDVEENTLRPLSKGALTDLVLYAADKIKSWGHDVLIYSGRNYSITELDLYRIKRAGYDLWVADYTGNRPKIRHTVWQYTSQKAVPGIDGPVDANYAYKDYTKGGNYMEFNELHGMRLKAISKKNKCETFPETDVNSTPVVVVPLGDSVEVLAVSNDRYTIPGTHFSAPWFKVKMQDGIRYAFGLKDVWETVKADTAPDPEPQPTEKQIVITGLDEASRMAVIGLATKFGGNVKEV